MSVCMVAFALIHLSQDHANRLPDWALGGFKRAAENPLLQADARPEFLCPMAGKTVAWQGGDVFNPASAVKGDRLFVFFRAEDLSGIGIGSRTSRIGVAETRDGITLDKKPNPVLYPQVDDQQEDEWPGGCEDPRVAVTRDGLYVMTYTQWNRKTPRLAVATSRDLLHWKKFGPAFREADHGKFAGMASKSASIVTVVEKGRQVIAKVQGKYWMYWGESAVFAATSEDLTSWQPVLDDKGDLKPVIRPRSGYFDSQLTECGPPAVLTEKGIILLYNGKNLSGVSGDRRFNAGSYCAGQVLISSQNPMKAIDRLSSPFFRPMEAYERSGQYADGTVFVEGLSFFRGQWFLYYGCADSRVSVAILDPRAKGSGDPLPDNR